MKTLNEIIYQLENCAPLADDVLFYLKEYRWIIENCAEALAEKYPSENIPLTWDELNQMEGKPVWVELFGSGLGEWDLCHAQLNDRIWFTDGTGLIFDLSEETLGKTWQAYRKEHHDDN